LSQFFVGDPAPWFKAETGSTPHFNFSLAAGRYVCLLFMDSRRDPAIAEALQVLAVRRGVFDDAKVCLFGVTADPADRGQAELADAPGLRWFFDDSRAIAGLYGLAEGERTRPHWLVLDPTLRVIAQGAPAEFAAMVEQLPGLPAPELHAGGPVFAPVLVVPRVFEPEFCKILIDLYRKHGGTESGFMREIDGKTTAISDPKHKLRSDFQIEDEAIRDACRARVLRRIVPEVKKVFQFEVTRMERYLVACYDGARGGHFNAHRDNTTKGTAHRRFAVTLNLNAEDYEGGELRFAEFGPRTYRPPTGGAVVFSCSLMHEATRVTRGERFAFLPFLYDEAAAKIREANNPHLDQGVSQYVPEASEEQAQAGA
jgi:predicted 2-oxoglutarate/Fe(II)-dependent dioxygenase YbiX